MWFYPDGAIPEPKPDLRKGDTITVVDVPGRREFIGVVTEVSSDRFTLQLVVEYPLPDEDDEEMP